MIEKKQVITRITSIDRAGTSFYGNPQLRINTPEGSWLTRQNASVGYYATNFLHGSADEHRPVVITLEKYRKYWYVTNVEWAGETTALTDSVPFPGVRVTAFIGADDAKVIQIDTQAEVGHIRVNLNDGQPLFNGDPEKHDAPGIPMK